MRVIAVCLFLLSATTLATAADLTQCVNIDNALERLACYDAAARRSAPMPPPAVTAVPPAPPQPAPVPEPTPSNKTLTVTAVPLAVPEPAPAPKPFRANKPGDEEFGREAIRDGQKKEIVTRYDGEFTGWSGRTVFKLENGQVWRQAESGRFRTSLDRPTIHIQRGAFGSYRLKVAGMNRTIRVKRIR